MDGWPGEFISILFLYCQLTYLLGHWEGRFGSPVVTVVQQCCSPMLIFPENMRKSESCWTDTSDLNILQLIL